MTSSGVIFWLKESRPADPPASAPAVVCSVRNCSIETSLDDVFGISVSAGKFLSLPESFVSGIKLLLIADKYDS